MKFVSTEDRSNTAHIQGGARSSIHMRLTTTLWQCKVVRFFIFSFRFEIFFVSFAAVVVVVTVAAECTQCTRYRPEFTHPFGRNSIIPDWHTHRIYTFANIHKHSSTTTHDHLSSQTILLLAHKHTKELLFSFVFLFSSSTFSAVIFTRIEIIVCK